LGVVLLLAQTAAASRAERCVTPRLTAAVQEAQKRAAVEDRAYEWTERLVIECGPRLAGTAAEQHAAEWAMTEMGDAGLANVRAQPFAFTGWTRGEARVDVVAPFQQTLSAAALGGSVGTPSEGIEASVVRFPDVATLEQATTADVAGHIVFIDQRMSRARDRSNYVSARPVRSDAPVIAARKHAVAVVIRSLGTDTNRLPHVGMTRYAPDVTSIPAFALSIPDADLLALMQARAGSVTLRLYSSARQQPQSTSRNVMGDIMAPVHTREVVLLAAHVDSWDVGSGAVDDASGVGVMLAVAGIVRAHRDVLRRNVRFVLYGAEEFGGAGAQAYVDAHVATSKHVAAIEEDLGSGRLWRLQLPRRDDASGVADVLERTLTPLGIELSRDYAAFGGTDLEPLRALGVPVYDLDPDASSYFDVHHTANDTLTQVSAEGLRQHVSAFASFALLLAGVSDECLSELVSVATGSMH